MQKGAFFKIKQRKQNSHTLKIPNVLSLRIMFDMILGLARRIYVVICRKWWKQIENNAQFVSVSIWHHNGNSVGLMCEFSYIHCFREK